MRILRIRIGFQADHSSSSYLFYAVDSKVSAAGRQVAHRFSSRAEVDQRTAFYQKWGESELSDSAYEALLGEHYDVMASESYDSWKLLIALPRTPQLEELLRPFYDFDDGEFVRIDVHEYGKRLAVQVYCEFDEDAVWAYELESLVKMLAKIREEIQNGDVSFLQAVAHYYLSGMEEGEDEEAGEEPAGWVPPASWTKAELQQECDRRGVSYRKSWSKDELREALTSAAAALNEASPGIAKPGKLSPTARKIVNHLDQR